MLKGIKNMEEKRNTWGLILKHIHLSQIQGDHQFLELKIPVFKLFKMSTQWRELIPHLDRAAQPDSPRLSLQLP